MRDLVMRSTTRLRLRRSARGLESRCERYEFPTRPPVLSPLPGRFRARTSSQRLPWALPPTVGLLVNTPDLPADRAAYFVGLANRPDLQATVEM